MGVCVLVTKKQTNKQKRQQEEKAAENQANETSV